MYTAKGIQSTYIRLLLGSWEGGRPRLVIKEIRNGPDGP